MNEQSIHELKSSIDELVATSASYSRKLLWLMLVLVILVVVFVISFVS